MITINEVELASELAFLKTKEDLLRLGKIKDENYDMYYNLIWELKEKEL